MNKMSKFSNKQTIYQTQVIHICYSGNVPKSLYNCEKQLFTFLKMFKIYFDSLSVVANLFRTAAASKLPRCERTNIAIVLSQSSPNTASITNRQNFPCKKKNGVYVLITYSNFRKLARIWATN